MMRPDAFPDVASVPVVQAAPGPTESMTFWLVILGTAIIVFGVLLLARRPLSRVVRRVYVIWMPWVMARRHRRMIIGSSFFILVMFALSVAILAGMIAERESFLQSLAGGPGVFFAVATGLLTFVGVVLTFSQIHALTQRITRYDELLISAESAIRKELAIHSAEGRYIRLVCNTPLNGNLSERGTAHYERYKRALDIARHKAVLQILHMPPKSMEDFYLRFSDRVSPAEIQTAYDESQEFLRDVTATSNHRRAGRTAARLTDQLAEHETRYLWSEVGYRLLLTEDRVIFYVPLFLPPERATPAGIAATTNTRRARVEMIGFESDDRYVIGQLLDDFQYLWERSSRSCAQITEHIQPAHGRSIELSAMRVEPSLEQAVLIVHGLTDYVRDTRFEERLRFRGEIAHRGISSFEFEYRDRDRDKPNEANFSLTAAVKDLNDVLAHLIDRERCKRVLLVGRGMALPIVLASDRARQAQCPMIIWQPIPDPKTTMERRGHLTAFRSSYETSSSHNFVEIGSIRVGRAFFDDIDNFADIASKVWPDAKIDLFYSDNDPVAPSKDTEEFASTANARFPGGQEPVVLAHVDMPQGTHAHQTSIAPLVDATLDHLKKLNFRIPG